jgi:hypothetical protein
VCASRPQKPKPEASGTSHGPEKSPFVRKESEPQPADNEKETGLDHNFDEQIEEIGYSFDVEASTAAVRELAASSLHVCWRGPAKESMEASARRIHKVVELAEASSLAAATQRRLSLHLLHKVQENLRRNGSHRDAIQALLGMIYGLNKEESTETQKNKTRKLKYRLKAGRRWSRMVEQFGVGILAFPVADFPHSLCVVDRIP